MLNAITAFPEAIVLFASSLHPDMRRLRIMVESGGSRAIVIAENYERADVYLHQGIQGVLFRNATGAELEKCVRRVAVGNTSEPPRWGMPENDMVGKRVLYQLTPKERCIVALIAEGYKNREIGLRLKTTEQVIKNYLRTIFKKTGVRARIELALFTTNHWPLADMAAEMSRKLDAEQQQAAIEQLSRVPIFRRYSDCPPDGRLAHCDKESEYYQPEH
jgi:DNA-binding CsgD family transcriptional regulator